MNPLFLMRMARWVRHPPSMGRVILGLVVIAIGLGIVGLEWAGLWPDWATAESRGNRGIRIPGDL